MPHGNLHDISDPTAQPAKRNEPMYSIHEFASLLASMNGAPGRPKATQLSTQSDCYRFGGWQFDPAGRELVDPAGASVALTDGEYALLMAFLRAPRRLLARNHLAQAARIYDDSRDPCLDVLILGLRRKLEIDARAPKIIVTQRGAGYIFALDVDIL